MTAAIDTADSGAVKGRENVVFELHNTASSACQLDGYPTLRAGKALTSLKFPHVATYALGVTASGPIPAGGTARFTATVEVTGCSKAKVTYPTLGIELPGVQLLSMKFPKQLATAGCPISVTKIGPVASS